MYMYADSIQLEAPEWSGQARRRLLTSLAMSTACITTVLLVLRFPVVDEARPFTELLVRILVDEVESVVQPSEPEPVVEDSVEELPTTVLEESTAAAPDESTPATDWYAQIPALVTAMPNDEEPRYSVNPVFDEKRRRAAQQFRPSKAVRPKPIWENVEKDTLGRTVLQSGNCYRVLDDPNVGSRDAFLIFGQFMSTCFSHKEAPQELPWVKEIQSRRGGLARYGHPTAE